MMSALKTLKTSLATLILVLMAIGLGGCAAVIRNDGMSQQRAAETELHNLQTRLESGNYRQHGFKSRAEVEQATLGIPLPVMNMTLEKLSAFKAGDEVGKFISSPDQIIYPVMVQGSTRSAILIKASGASWYGTGKIPNHFVVLDALRETSARTLLVDRSDLFLIRVDALNEQFLAGWSRGSLMLIAVRDDSFSGLKAGEMAPAQDVFLKLSGYARQLRATP